MRGRLIEGPFHHLWKVAYNTSACGDATPHFRRESAIKKGNAMSPGDVLWVLAVFAFWALVFCLMFLFVSLISRGRDGEETTCEVPQPTPSPVDTTGHVPA